jgi:hypothetical protein
LPFFVLPTFHNLLISCPLSVFFPSPFFHFLLNMYSFCINTMYQHSHRISNIFAFPP